MRNIWILRTNAGGAYCTQYFIHANRMQNVVCDNKPACRTCSLFATSQIKFRVAHIKVFAVKFFLNQAEAFTETLEMDYLSCPKETDGICNLRDIFHHPEDIIVGGACLLFWGDLVSTTYTKI